MKVKKLLKKLKKFDDRYFDLEVSKLKVKVFETMNRYSSLAMNCNLNDIYGHLGLNKLDNNGKR